MSTDPVTDNGDYWQLGDVVSATANFNGELGSIAGARQVVERFLTALAELAAPRSPASRDDILLVVTELVTNAVQYAPGPFTLRLRRSFDGVHVAVRDTNPVSPVPRPPQRTGDAGGFGWCLIATLANQVSILPDPKGKEIHAFMPW